MITRAHSMNVIPQRELGFAETGHNNADCGSREIQCLYDLKYIVLESFRINYERMVLPIKGSQVSDKKAFYGQSTPTNKMVCEYMYDRDEIRHVGLDITSERMSMDS